MTVLDPAGTPALERGRPACTLLAGENLRERARSLAPLGPGRAIAHCSRSYRDPFALAAWHSLPVGVDIERIEPVEAGFGHSIATPSESRLLTDRLSEPRLVASLWSSKEALAKALGEPLSWDPRRLESPLLWEHGARGRWRAEPLDAPPGHVAWICWRAR